VSGGPLGCGEYEVYVFERGGTDFLFDLPWDSLTWGRALDDTSSANLEAEVAINVDCRADIATLRPWRHEIGFYRDGEQVWVGPILAVRASTERLSIQARDITAWWDHRLIHRDHKYVVETDLATIFKDVSDDAMEPDTTPRVVVEPTETGVKSTMTILTAQHQKAGLVIRDLSRAGVDWTTVAREIIVGGQTVPVDSIGLFTDAFFANPPTVVLDGSQQANNVVVSGSGSGSAGATIYAAAPRKELIVADGLLEEAQTVSTIQDFRAALAAAESRVELASEIVAVQEAVLAPDAPYGIDELVPGALCELALAETIVPISGIFRLQSVSVTVNAQQNVEAVRLAFQPRGTTPESS
jgi:hypothetical protein